MHSLKCPGGDAGLPSFAALHKLVDFNGEVGQVGTVPSQHAGSYRSMGRRNAG
jgi:hypothetical protein